MGRRAEERKGTGMYRSGEDEPAGLVAPRQSQSQFVVGHVAMDGLTDEWKAGRGVTPPYIYRRTRDGQTDRQTIGTRCRQKGRPNYA